MRAHACLTLLLAPFAVGCASTHMTVRKVTETKQPPGIRYSLPQPFLLVTPNPEGDGGFKVEVVYLPDEDQTYAIDAKTVGGKYTLDVTVKDGLLSKVAWTRADAAQAAEMVRASSEVLKGELERAAKEQEDARKAQADARKAAQAELTQAEGAVRDKQLEVDLAEEEVRSAEEVLEQDSTPANRATVAAARLKVAQAKVRLRAAEGAAKRASDDLSSLGGTFNDPKAPAGVPGTFWGPVLYRVKDDGKTVALEAVEFTPGHAQLELPTVSPPKPAAPAVEAPKLTTSLPIHLTWPQGQATLSIGLAFDKALTSVVSSQITVMGPNGILTPAPLNVRFDPATPQAAELVLTDSTLKGDYTITLPFTHGAKNEPATVTFTVRVQAP